MLSVVKYGYIGLAVSYLLASSLGGYLLQPVHKALPIIWLAYWVAQFKFVNSWIVVVALVFSAIGDVLLAMDFSGHFKAGIVAFACAQIGYSSYFFSQSYWTSCKVMPLACIGILFVSVGFIVLPETGGLFWLVLFYAGSLMTMTGASFMWCRDKFWAFAGALVFVLSDSLIALNTFLLALPYERLLIMVTYYLAQGLIVIGVAKGQRERPATDTN